MMVLKWGTWLGLALRTAMMIESWTARSGSCDSRDWYENRFNQLLLMTGTRIFIDGIWNNKEFEPTFPYAVLLVSAHCSLFTHLNVSIRDTKVIKYRWNFRLEPEPLSPSSCRGTWAAASWRRRSGRAWRRPPGCRWTTGIRSTRDLRLKSWRILRDREKYGWDLQRTQSRLDDSLEKLI